MIENRDDRMDFKESMYREVEHLEALGYLVPEDGKVTEDIRKLCAR